MARARRLAPTPLPEPLRAAVRPHALRRSRGPALDVDAVSAVRATVPRRRRRRPARWVVNELLVQMQSFDEPTGMRKLLGRVVDADQPVPAAEHQLKRPAVPSAQHPADRLDQPRRLPRPGAACGRAGSTGGSRSSRPTKAVAPRADRLLPGHARRTTPSSTTRSAVTRSRRSPRGTARRCSSGCSTRRSSTRCADGGRAMSWSDVEQARLVDEVGLGQPVATPPTRSG